MSNFKHCLSIILKHEGGYVNHPKDPGGETNYGITRRTYEAWSGKTPDSIDMKTIPMEDVESIYKTQYWDRVHGDKLPSGVDLVVFDFAVNAGTGRAAKFLQQVVGATIDGAIGPKTISLVNGYNAEQLIDEYTKLRENHYRSLSTFITFGKGWLRRNNETATKAKQMIGN